MLFWVYTEFFMVYLIELKGQVSGIRSPCSSKYNVIKLKGLIRMRRLSNKFVTVTGLWVMNK
ncbi:hypothetical protein AM232_00355 [Bacillus sp. FJAT-21352]|nr:hypothetical protein AM232_00355 [Bacillus sp. FJAT-21352]